MDDRNSPDVLISVFSVAALVLLNGFFVAAEFALVKIRMTQIEAMLRRGKPLAKLTRSVLKKLDSYLSACQLGITLASLGLGWVGEPAVASFIRAPLSRLSFEAETIHGISFAIGFSFITALHIVLGELVPKTLAIQRAETIVLSVALPLTIFYRISYPAIWLLDQASRLILRPFGVRALPEHEVAYTEEELRLVLSRSPETEVSRFARSLALHAIELRKRPVREIILPRTRIVYLDSDLSLEENVRIARESGFTRFPLCQGSIDHALGMVHIKDLLWSLGETLAETRKPILESFKRDILFIPETLSLEQVLSQFLKGRTHMAIVLDEYGGTIGMVTLEDVLEELVGEIQDEFDHESPRIVRLPTATEEYIAEGAVPLYQLNAFCGTELRAEGVDTLSGFLVKTLGRIPALNEEVTVDRLHFVMKKVGRRGIHQVLVRKLAGTPNDPESQDAHARNADSSSASSAHSGAA